MLAVANASSEMLRGIPAARHASKTSYDAAELLDEFVKTFPKGVSQHEIVRTLERVWKRELSEGAQVLDEQMKPIQAQWKFFADAYKKLLGLDFPTASPYLTDLFSRADGLREGAKQLILAFNSDTSISRSGAQVDPEREQEVVDRLLALPDAFRDLLRHVEEVRPALLAAMYDDALEEARRESIADSKAKVEVDPSGHDPEVMACSTVESAVFRYVLNAAEGRHDDAVSSLRSVANLVTPALIKSTIETLVADKLVNLEIAESLREQVRDDLIEARRPRVEGAQSSIDFASRDPGELELIRLGLEQLGFNIEQVEKLELLLNLDQAERLDIAMRNLQMRGYADILPGVAQFVIVTDPHVLTKDELGIEQRLARACELWRKATKAGVDPATMSGVPELVERYS